MIVNISSYINYIWNSLFTDLLFFPTCSDLLKSHHIKRTEIKPNSTSGLKPLVGLIQTWQHATLMSSQAGVGLFSMNLPPAHREQPLQSGSMKGVRSGRHWWIVNLDKKKKRTANAVAVMPCHYDLHESHYPVANVQMISLLLLLCCVVCVSHRFNEAWSEWDQWGPAAALCWVAATLTRDSHRWCIKCIRLSKPNQPPTFFMFVKLF